MSGLTVEALGRDAAALAHWDRYVSTHPDGTVYHLSAWRAIFEQSFGYRSWLLAARDPESGRLEGALPLYLVRTPFTRRIVSVPFRDRGGALWSAADAFHALLIEAGKIARDQGAGNLCLKTLRPYPRELVTANSLKEHFHWVHSSVKLPPGAAEELWVAIGDKNRNMVRQAERNGLQCEACEADEESISTWYRLHVSTQKRLGIPPFPRKFFSRMAEELRSTGNIALFRVRAAGTPVAATIVLLHGKTGIYGYSASEETGHVQRANDLMLYGVMRWLIEQGYDTLDMGSDSPLQESLLFFKRKWLAEQSPIPQYYKGDATQADSSDRRYALARRCLRLVPAPVLATMCSSLTRYLG